MPAYRLHLRLEGRGQAFVQNLKARVNFCFCRMGAQDGGAQAVYGANLRRVDIRFYVLPALALVRRALSFDPIMDLRAVRFRITRAAFSVNVIAATARGGKPASSLSR